MSQSEVVQMRSRVQAMRDVPDWMKHDDEDDVIKVVRPLVEQIRNAKSWARLDDEEKLVTEYRALLSRRMYRINDTAMRWDRDLNEEERLEFDALSSEYDSLAGEGPLTHQQTMEVTP